MLTQYLAAALRQAHYEILDDSHDYYGEISGFQGVWATAPSLEACRDELAQVLEEWVLFRISEHLPLPEVDGITLSVREVA